MQRLHLELLPELNLLLRLYFGATYWTNIIIFKPLFDTLGMEKVVLVVRQGRDAVLAIVELLHTNATLVNAGPVELPTEFAMDQCIDKAAGEVVVTRLHSLVEWRRAVCNLLNLAAASDHMLTEAWRKYVISQLVERDDEQGTAADYQHGKNDRYEATDDHEHEEVYDDN